MRFLLADIGKEDLLLGYPWLSTFEPKFSWKHGTIDENTLPIVIKSCHPKINVNVVARLLSDVAKDNIIAKLGEHSCYVRAAREPDLGNVR